MAIKIMVSNQKGGVGKSTTVCAFASLLEAVGKKVLVVDLDPQGNSSQVFNVYKKGAYDTNDIFMNDVPMDDLILESPNSNVKVISSGSKHWETVKQLNQRLVNEKEDEIITILRRRIAEIEEKFEYIIFDTNPSRDILIENAMAASDYLIVPVEGEGFSYESLNIVLTDINKIKNQYNQKLVFLGTLFVKAEPRTTLFKQIYKEFVNELKDDAIKQPIRKDNLLKEANSSFTPLFRYVKRSKGGTDYINAAYEIGLINKKDYKKLIEWHGLKNDSFNIKELLK